MKNVEEILCDLIRIRTDNSVKSNNDFVNYVCDFLLQEGVRYKKISNTNENFNNILAGINIEEFKNIGTGLILSGHMDTVSANFSDWDTNPFEGTIINDNIYGRGTMDMKYFIAVVLSLIPEIKKANIPVFFAFSCDEETDVQGVRALTSFLKVRNIHPKYALIGEATHFDLCVSSRGYIGYTTIVKGVSAHSGDPSLGTNAAYIAAKIISKIEKLNEQYISQGTSLNVGVIQGGVGRNSVPSEVSIDWEIRYDQEEDKIQIIHEMEILYEQLRKDYKNAHILIKTKEELPSFERAENSNIIKLAQNILNTQILTLPYATEAGFYQELGLETLVCGAGDEKLAHSSSEHISISDLKKYRNFLMDFILSIRENLETHQIKLE